MTDSTLSNTIGPLSAASESRPLNADDRRLIAAWIDQRWTALEQRAGALCDRDPDAWYALLVREGWRSEADTSALSAGALAAFYRLKPLIPRAIQLGLRRRLVARQGEPVFPSWPFDPAGSELVRIAFAEKLLERDGSAARFAWFWPGGARAAATLTHDVESGAGLEAAAEIGTWEEALGFRSSFNIVSEWYPLDMEKVRHLADRGHEIGSHAIHHDRSLFASREAFESQLPKLREAGARLGAVGFRSPATHRVTEWMSDLPFSYDCTVPHSDPYEPIPGGVATIWPFFYGDVVELPYTAPQDHTLFNLLGHTDGRLWRRQLEQICEAGGMFQILTHPDPEYLGRPAIAAAYRDLLGQIAARDDLWVALPRDIAGWWRRRSQGGTPGDSGLASWTGDGIELAPMASRVAERR